ncbi:MAG: glycosyltransferase, partial [Candidatus Magnetoovum sp. WYHC-5]|nr:glycosyltransferase [Candidatus Magnetoovum sp. WYHC-5]
KSVIEEPLDIKVSVIVPTKNAGVELDYVLRRVVQQEGIKDIELITIDSGSTDDTVEICKSYTSNVFQIAPEEFHHANTRTLGGEKASGDYLVFITQDSIPVGNQWLYKLIMPVYKDEVSAVSVKQIIRSDADLFATWANFTHNFFMQFERDRVSNSKMFKSFAELDVQSKRIIAGLDNVCMAIKKEVFDKYKFAPGYAEDLDLGIKLINDGHSLMFQASNAVIHSHNRPPLYFFKRSYVDGYSLSELLKVQRLSYDVQAVVESIHYLYCVLKMSLSALDLKSRAYNEVGEVMQSFMEYIVGKMILFDTSWQLIEGDKEFDDFFVDYKPVSHQNIVKELNNDLLFNLKRFADFVSKHKKLSEVRDVFADNVYKLFANTAGSYLATHTMQRIEGLVGGI